MKNKVVNLWQSMLTSARFWRRPMFLSPYAAPLMILLIGSLMSCEESFDDPEEFSRINDTEFTPAEVSPIDADLPHDEIARLRHAVARYHNIDNALADGYDFEFTGYRSRMGYHYMKASLVDDRFEVEKPEVLMYAPSPDGGLRFVGVEYATPIADMNNPPAPPEGFSGGADRWTINTEFEVWTLHVWVGLQNPHGIFASHNPRLP